jgi:hypothetical protein
VKKLSQLRSAVNSRRRHREVRAILPRCLSEPAPTRAVEGALFGVTKQRRNLVEMQPRFREISRRLLAALPFDEFLASHAFGSQASLQGPWMHRELVADGLHAALAGGQ